MARSIFDQQRGNHNPNHLLDVGRAWQLVAASVSSTFSRDPQPSNALFRGASTRDVHQTVK